jgi:ubiquinol-cytochrome c reductase cytochrome c subunit
MTRARRAALSLVAFGALFVAVATLTRPPAHAQSAPPADPQLVARGRRLFSEACASCHATDLRGRPGRGPSLHGVGARSADFYLSTGRMPLSAPDEEPVRTHPAYGAGVRAALVSFIASFGGPGIPAVDPARGDLAEGRKLFTDHCAGCHQVVARGGVVPPAGVAPALQQATPVQVAEAVRIGPYTMPAFSSREIDARQLTSIARYVAWTRHPEDRGGWGIGNIGPVPEGMVAWLIGGLGIVLVARLLGERTA